jgi:hypothetical protein
MGGVEVIAAGLRCREAGLSTGVAEVEAESEGRREREVALVCVCEGWSSELEDCVEGKGETVLGIAPPLPLPLWLWLCAELMFRLFSLCLRLIPCCISGVVALDEGPTPPPPPAAAPALPDTDAEPEPGMDAYVTVTSPSASADPTNLAPLASDGRTRRVIACGEPSESTVRSVLRGDTMGDDRGDAWPMEM